MVDGRGGLRPHWRGVLGALTALGEGGLQERGRRLERAFDEEGVTSVLPGTHARDSSWRCDPVPLPLGAAEFADLEAGLAQRARLLEAVLADLYGSQQLLADGALPTALVFPNRSFLRPCRALPGAPLMQFYAADLVRGPDGAWRVLADRTASPTGIGYARENRRLLMRVLPEAFRPVQVRQLRPFFDVWQDALQNLAPAKNGRSSATVALLTAGTRDPHWFEHMYLSRELSCALVEGGDLTVRGGVLFLKTLEGLQQVDVLLRHVEGRLVDPLELDTGAGLGVTGLLDAMRSGTVRLANDPGTGLVEAPALSAFLPALAMRLLGERLLMASVPTMWLGEERARSLVQQDPARWLIRSALDGAALGVTAESLPADKRAALLEKIEARPWEWAASAIIPPSVVPCVDASGMTPRPVALRLFLVNDGAGWRAMPGGLARVLDDAQALAGRLPTSGLSKDVWVMAEDRSDIVGPAVAVQPRLAIRRSTGDLPSRVADDLFWLGRYVERLERAARLIRAAVARLARGATVLPREIADVTALARCLVQAGFISEEAAEHGMTSALSNSLLGLLREDAPGVRGGAVFAMFGKVAALTESVRDRLTGEMYGTFTQTLRAAREDAAGLEHSLDSLSHAMVSVLRFSTAVAGTAAENMVRGGGWLFLDLGRRIERAQSVVSQVAEALDRAPARMEPGLRLVLELCDSAITYRSRYLNVVQAAPVLDLVLADQGNPRGLAFQLAAIHTLLDELNSTGGTRELLAGTAAGLLAEAEMLVAGVLEAPDQSVAAAGVPAKLREIGSAIAALSDRINRRYFVLLPAVQTVGWDSGETELRGAA